MIDFNVQALSQAIQKQPHDFSFSLKGLYGSARYLPVASLARQKCGVIHLYVCESSSEATYATSDLTAILDASRVYFFPTSFRGVLKTKREDVSYQVQRTAAIQAMMEWDDTHDDLIVLTYPEALEEGIPALDQLQQNSLTITVGNKLSHAFIKECLFSYGFERVDFVSEPGQIAIRGSIIDVFSFSENKPFRINFFGDEIEEIRVFDINTQRSIDQRASITLVPKLKGETSLMEVLQGKAYVWKDTLVYDVSPEQEVPTPTDVITFETAPQPSFNKNYELLVRDITQKKALGYSVYILSDNKVQQQRLDEIFESLGCKQHFVDFLSFSLHEGFVDHQDKLCLYTDHQLFERLHRVQLKRAVQKSEQLTINELSGFQIGDYIVHIDHGVGIFGGLVKTNINGKPQEVIKLIYRDNDVLLVNIHSLHCISRYKSKDSTPPKIYKLGTGAWNKIKQQTKKKVKDIAQDLIKLYSQRVATKGHAYSQDTYLQHELEASFLFEDTPDQLQATRDVKNDMEQPYPMDRLICGDVGFGKTEVAVRAAFKAATEGKQTAVLVPTTILALQHYHTFTDRLQQFPVNIQFVSRLRTTAEIKDILAQTNEGKIDILIGTHRLLNQDVHFKDLGLLVIDEEQKFGVTAKERLKQMKINVDTLTMTATPIPRTLQFSLMGARDLSIIQTPPLNRLPIHTEVQVFDENIIREAIDLEMDRGGQIFFVHNRVQDIEEVAAILHRIYPGLRIGIGHGQMPPKDLEAIILDFILGNYDLLLATSIIENGIDIPNANTIIINHAHMFGLSDLHQMRGRVGRSNRKAYCYLLVPSLTSLTDDAKRRLKAIEAFTELGSGFNIAMQDLDIRGAGNLLGGEQSGFIADMGFEAYQRILEEAFAELGESAQGGVAGADPAAPGADAGHVRTPIYLTDCAIETDLELLIPDDYIDQVPEKIRLYKELDKMKDDTQLTQFFAALEDRFGPVPEPLRQLGFVVRLRRLAISLGFERIVLKNGIMLAYFIHNQQSDYYKAPLFAHIMTCLSKAPNYSQVKEQNEKLYVRVSHVETVEVAYNYLIFFAKP